MRLAAHRMVGRTLFRRCLACRGDRGATATEYALLIGLIAIVIVGGIALFGSGLDTWFSTLAGGLP